MVNTPFTAFNFKVLITLDGGEPLCDGAFSQVEGLDMSIDVKTIRQGGDNGREIHLAGPLTNSKLTLKRGMTTSFDLWDWFDRVTVDNQRHLRATAIVVMLHSNGQTEQATFVLSRCLPVKLRAPSLAAVDGQVAIEELQLAYESLRLRKPQQV
jgi:phage tail-like protein